MRAKKMLASVVSVGIALVGLTATTESTAGDESLVNVSCTAGAITATAVSPWHTNAAAPWKWHNGDQKLKPASADDHSVTFTGGGTCAGTLHAFVCNGDQCKGPIKIPVH